MGGAASARKGAQAERDLARMLTDLLDTPVRRELGAGRADDVGDLDGVHGFAVQVANRANLGDTLRNKPHGAQRQAANRDVPFAVTAMKLPPQPGGKPPEWRFVMTPEQFADIWKALEGIRCR